MNNTHNFRILLLTFYYEPDLCAGSFRATSLIEAFKNILSPNDNIDVVTTMPNRYKTFKVEAKQFEQQDNVTIHRIPIPSHKSGLLDQARSFSKYFFKTLTMTKNRDYDIVIATSSRLFTAFLGTITARRLKTPLYLDIRDIFTDTMNELLTNRFVKRIALPLLKIIEKFTFNSADHINLVSEGFRDYFSSRYKKSYSFFTNGIDSEFLAFNFIQTKKHTKSIITYAGNIGEGQGLHLIIPEAAKELKGEFEFQIIGDGGAKAILVSEVKRLALKNVQFIDPVSREHLKKYYKESDFLFLHLNDYKAFEKVLPSKIFEYAATNKPIIAGVGGFASEFLREYVSNVIIFKPGDTKDFIKKIRKFQYDQTIRTAFFKKFSRSNIMREMTDQIKSQFLAPLTQPVK